MHKAKITVVGLGSGDVNQLSLGVWQRLQQAEKLYLRTAQHPVVKLLDEQHIHYESFDSIYEARDSFPQVYEAIVKELLSQAEQQQAEIVYAVPGHPLVAEATVQLLKERCTDQIALELMGGESFLDQAFLRLGFDPIEGFQLLDGSQLERALLQPRMHTIVAQVYDTFTASEAKLTLMEVYPDDFEIVVAHALGVAGEEQVHTIPLYEMDRMDGYGNLSLVWIPRAEEEAAQRKMFSRLQEIVTILRSPEGCPWDQEQTHQSIRKNLIEETYEVLETIDDDDPVAMCEELGDLLMQILLHAEMEAELGTFDVYDVIAGLHDKLIRRHPHVFGDIKAGDAEEALRNWQQIKDEEKRSKGEDVELQSVLSGVPRELPALMKALELQKRAAKVGFDWERLQDVFAKLEEECEELKEECKEWLADDSRRLRQHKLQIAAQQEELGDVLFSIVNVARFLGIDPDAALSAANRKFVERFSYLEQQLRLNQKTFAQTDLREMESWWQKAKYDR